MGEGVGVGVLVGVSVGVKVADALGNKVANAIPVRERTGVEFDAATRATTKITIRATPRNRACIWAASLFIGNLTLGDWRQAGGFCGYLKKPDSHQNIFSPHRQQTVATIPTRSIARSVEPPEWEG